MVVDRNHFQQLVIVFPQRLLARETKLHSAGLRRDRNLIHRERSDHKLVQPRTAAADILDHMLQRIHHPPGGIGAAHQLLHL